MKKALLKIAAFVVSAVALIGSAACGATGKNVKVLKDIELTAEEYAFAVQKGNDSLKTTVDTMIAEMKEDGSFVLAPEDLLALLEDIHADGLDGRANKAYLTPEFAAELAKRDLSLAIWTVDDVETAEYFINTVKPEAITSNRAAYLQGVIDLGKDR